MKKRLALIIISLDECFSKDGFSGGGHKVTKNLILGFIDSGKFDIDIYCKKSSIESLDGITSITVLDNKKIFFEDLKNKLSEKNYDYVLSSDILVPFANNSVHSNTSKYKSKNGKNKLMQFILKFYNSKKIKAQEKCLLNNPNAVFTVSENLKKDIIENFNYDEKRVFVTYPGIGVNCEFISPVLKETFIIGGLAGGGLNKGGYLLLLALKQLPKTYNFKARIIFPKIHKAFFFKLCTKLLGLQGRVEVLPKQADMDTYFKSVDCYVLPSLNEAFGLVVPEAAANSKPSIVSSTAGASELIKEGENGFVFDRSKTPVKNLVQKLIEVMNIYFNNHLRFIEISKNAYEIPKKLDWINFTDTIANNMIEVNKVDKRKIV